MDKKHEEIRSDLWKIFWEHDIFSGSGIPEQQHQRIGLMIQDMALFFEKECNTAIFQAKEKWQKQRPKSNYEQEIDELEKKNQKYKKDIVRLKTEIDVYQRIIGNSNFRMAVTKRKKDD